MPDSAAMPVVARRKAALVNLVFQYSTLGLALIHSLLLVPLYLRFIDTSLYGAWLASGNVIYWAAVAQGGTTYLLSQRSAHFFGQRQMKALGENVGSGLLLLAVLSTFAGVIAAGLTPFISGWFKIQGVQATQLEWAYIGAIVTLWLRLLCIGFIAVEQGYQRPFGVGIISLVTGIIHLVVTIAFLFLGWGLLAIPLGLLVREVLCFTSLALHLAHTNRQLGVHMRVTREAIRALTGLSVWTFFTFLNDAIDNGTVLLLVALLLDTETVAALTVSKAAWEILIAVLLRLVTSVQPGLAHLNGEGNRKNVIQVSNQMMLIIFAGLAVGTGVIWALNAPFAVIWSGKPQLYAGNLFTVLYTLVAVFSILTFGISQIVLSLGAIRLSSIVQTVVNTIRILAIAALMIPLGILSVPVGAGISLALFGWLLLRNWQDIVLHSRTIPWRGLLRGVRLLAAAAIVGCTGSALLHPGSWFHLALSAIGLTLLMCVIVLMLEPPLLEVAQQILRLLRAQRKT